MSCPTKPFRHTGTTDATDIGPSSGGYLHSVTISGAQTGSAVTIRDGGSSGTIIFVLYTSAAVDGSQQFFFRGLRIGGQLNITLAATTTSVTVEMSE